jgi:hypothetical protein
MYVASDPRAKLTSGTPAKPLQSLSSANYARFYETEPRQISATARTWYARGESFVMLYSETQAGAQFVRTDQPDEFMVLLPDAAGGAIVEWGGETTRLEGHSVTFVPPGASRIEMTGAGRIVQFFTTLAADLVAACPPGYEADPNVPPLQPWPEPEGGFKVRTYSMDIPPEAGRLGRILRSTNFMVNYIYPRSGPRDRTAMSPHSHAEFQQCSLSLEGTYVHHLRWPWGNDANFWREDEHAVCQSPSMTVIPAQVIHTSEAVAPGTNFLIDVFCPPRHDFSRQPGWVLNADDYPEAPLVGGGPISKDKP